MTGAAASARPRVGLGVLLFRGDSVLIGQRLSKTAQGIGEYALPGGHLEYGESLECCAARELLEETGIKVEEKDFTFETVENVIFPSAHYVTLFMRATAPPDATPVNMEPDKCAGWEWCKWPAGVPSPVFQPLQQLIDSGKLQL